MTNVPASPDYFELFGLTPRFALDLDALEIAYQRVQSRVHPDRHAAGTAADRRAAMHWAALANEAYRTLRDEGRRAAYLCELAGVPIDASSNTAMPASFLARQLEWREALAESRAQGLPVAELQAEVDEQRSETLRALAEALDFAQDRKHAAALVRQLMFIDRFRAELRAGGESRSAHSTRG